VLRKSWDFGAQFFVQICRQGLYLSAAQLIEGDFSFKINWVNVEISSTFLAERLRDWRSCDKKFYSACALDSNKVNS
jgi:hypothetical protein